MRALVVLVLVAAVAHADTPNLVLEREPPPRNLKMRRAAQAQAPTAPARGTPMPAAPTATATDLAPIAGIDGVRDVKQPVSFSLSVGYQIDGARPTGRATLGGPAPRTSVDYETLRSYGFAEGFLSTRGIGLTSLSSYFAVRFQAARRLSVTRTSLLDGDPEQPTGRIPLASPIATWFERSGAELRMGWAEVKDFLPKRWGLSRLRFRAGDQYIYGPWIVHMFGSNLAYEGKTVTLSQFSGFRRSDYTREQEDNQPLVSGGTFRFDLRGLTRQVPIAVAGEYLALSKSTATGQPATTSSQLQADWRPQKDVAVIGAQRWLDGNVANQRLEVRTRFRQVTNVVFELMRRYDSDWRWDPTLVRRDNRVTDLTEARRYLDLGPPRPQTLVSLRGGTLIAENVDLFARIAISNDQSDSTTPVQTYTASYFELAGAAEVRLRRTVALGASVLTRSSDRDALLRITDERNTPQPLPESAVMGEDRFTEVGTTVRMTLGARRFSALLELYGRRTLFARAYEDMLLPVEQSDTRGGGRFTIDAWVGRRVRLFASYDVSSALETSPEITGYKSLRLTLTGVY
ncbi:MAG TPA: hypothetical protein VK427_12380 [Kofleriaceae bacterium]|nr:hypothetical protein [Kofleriaceae bacterium]